MAGAVFGGCLGSCAVSRLRVRMVSSRGRHRVLDVEARLRVRTVSSRGRHRVWRLAGLNRGRVQVRCGVVVRCSFYSECGNGHGHRSASRGWSRRVFLQDSSYDRFSDPGRSGARCPSSAAVGMACGISIPVFFRQASGIRSVRRSTCKEQEQKQYVRGGCVTSSLGS